MKRLLIALSVLAAAAVVATQSRITFADSDSNMVLRDFDSWSLNLVRKGISFKGSGNPMTAAWSLQGITIVAQRIDGSAARIKDQQGYSLQAATVSGNVRLSLAKEGPYGVQTTRMVTESLRFNSGQQSTRIEVPSALTLTSSTRATGGTIELKGSSAVVLIAGNEGKEFTSAEISGPVTFSSTESDSLEWNINGRADRITIDNSGSAPVMQMVGNVQIKGNHPVLYGDLSGVDRATVKLKPDYLLESIEITGSPARTSAREVVQPKGRS